MNELQITEYKNIRVLTTQQIAEVDITTKTGQRLKEKRNCH